MRQPQFAKASDGCVGSAPLSEGSSAPMIRNRPLPMMKPSGAPSWGRSPQGPLAAGRVLGRDQRGPAPLAAEREALGEPHQHEQRGGDPAGLRVGGQRADEEGGDAHGEQRDDQRLLAAEPVTEVPEEDGADRPGDHRGAEDRERRQQRRGGVAAREEELREDEDGGGRVDVEVVELDRRPHEAGDEDPRPGIDRRLRCGDGSWCGHGQIFHVRNMYSATISAVLLFGKRVSRCETLASSPTRGAAQHSMMLTASPPRAVSLYLTDMSAPVSFMVLMTLSRRPCASRRRASPSGPR